MNCAFKMKVSILEARRAKTFTVSFRGLKREQLMQLVEVIDYVRDDASFLLDGELWLDDLFEELCKDLPNDVTEEMFGEVDD